MAAKDLHYLVIIKELQDKLKSADPTYHPQNYEAMGAIDSNSLGPLGFKQQRSGNKEAGVAASQQIELKPFVRRGVLLNQASNSQAIDEDFFAG